MVSPKFEYAEKSVEGRDACAMVVKVEGELDAASIRSAVQCIIDSVPALMREYAEKPGRVFPVQLELPDGARLSEHALWNMLIDTCIDASQLVYEYVYALCEHCPEERWGRVLPWNTPEMPAGSVPLFVLIDRLEIPAALRDEKNLPLLDAYLQYLELCDLDHEVYQDSYLTKLFSLSRLDPDRHIRLLHFRLIAGQWGIASKGFGYLHQHMGHKYLKPLIDYDIKEYLSDPDAGRSFLGLGEYMRLLAVVYGSNTDCIKDVIGYIEHASGRSLEESLSVYQQREIDQLAERCDGFWKQSRAKEGYLDSGFHLYNLKTKMWEKYPM